VTSLIYIQVVNKKELRISETPKRATLGLGIKISQKKVFTGFVAVLRYQRRFGNYINSNTYL
jgi:hypothetical protein